MALALDSLRSCTPRTFRKLASVSIVFKIMASSTSSSVKETCAGEMLRTQLLLGVVTHVRCDSSHISPQCRPDMHRGRLVINVQCSKCTSGIGAHPNYPLNMWDALESEGFLSTDSCASLGFARMDIYMPRLYAHNEGAVTTYINILISGRFSRNRICFNDKMPIPEQCQTAFLMSTLAEPLLIFLFPWAN